MEKTVVVREKAAYAALEVTMQHVVKSRDIESACEWIDLYRDHAPLPVNIVIDARENPTFSEMKMVRHVVQMKRHQNRGMTFLVGYGRLVKLVETMVEKFTEQPSQLVWSHSLEDAYTQLETILHAADDG